MQQPLRSQTKGGGDCSKAKMTETNDENLISNLYYDSLNLWMHVNSYFLSVDRHILSKKTVLVNV